MAQSHKEVADTTRAYLKKLMLKVSLLRIQAKVVGKVYTSGEIDLMPMYEVVNILEELRDEYKKRTVDNTQFNYTDSQQRERIRRVMDDLGSMTSTPIRVEALPLAHG